MPIARPRTRRHPEDYGVFPGDFIPYLPEPSTLRPGQAFIPGRGIVRAQDIPSQEIRPPRPIERGRGTVPLGIVRPDLVRNIGRPAPSGMSPLEAMRRRAALRLPATHPDRQEAERQIAAERPIVPPKEDVRLTIAKLREQGLTQRQARGGEIESEAQEAARQAELEKITATHKATLDRLQAEGKLPDTPEGRLAYTNELKKQADQYEAIGENQRALEAMKQAWELEHPEVKRTDIEREPEYQLETGRTTTARRVTAEDQNANGIKDNDEEALEHIYSNQTVTDITVQKELGDIRAILEERYGKSAVSQWLKARAMKEKESAVKP